MPLILNGQNVLHYGYLRCSFYWQAERGSAGFGRGILFPTLLLGLYQWRNSIPATLKTVSPLASQYMAVT